jgi:hypothetical protein
MQKCTDNAIGRQAGQVVARQVLERVKATNSMHLALLCMSECTSTVVVAVGISRAPNPRRCPREFEPSI